MFCANCGMNQKMNVYGKEFCKGPLDKGYCRVASDHHAWIRTDDSARFRTYQYYRIFRCNRRFHTDIRPEVSIQGYDHRRDIFKEGTIFCTGKT